MLVNQHLFTYAAHRYCDYLCSQAVSAGRELVLRAPPPTPPQLPGGLGGGRGAGGRGGGRGLGRGLGNNKDAAATALAMARYEKSQVRCVGAVVWWRPGSCSRHREIPLHLQVHVLLPLQPAHTAAPAPHTPTHPRTWLIPL